MAEEVCGLKYHSSLAKEDRFPPSAESKGGGSARNCRSSDKSSQCSGPALSSTDLSDTSSSRQSNPHPPVHHSSSLSSVFSEHTDAPSVRPQVDSPSKNSKGDDVEASVTGEKKTPRGSAFDGVLDVCQMTLEKEPESLRKTDPKSGEGTVPLLSCEDQRREPTIERVTEEEQKSDYPTLFRRHFRRKAVCLTVQNNQHLKDVCQLEKEKLQQKKNFAAEAAELHRKIQETAERVEEVAKQRDRDAERTAIMESEIARLRYEFNSLSTQNNENVNEPF